MRSQAVVYNASLDLLANEVPNGQEANPNGTWTYGGYDDVGSPSRAFTVIPFVAPAVDNPGHLDDYLSLNGGFQGWANIGFPDGDGTPSIVVNTTADGLTPCCGITPISSHKILFQSGPGDRSIFDDATVRWTAPGPGTIDVTANWIQRHDSPQEVDVLVNGVVVFTALASEGLGTTYSATLLPVARGDTVDFVINQGPYGYQGGATEFDATISPAVAFQSFSPKVLMKFGPATNDDSATVESDVVLGADSDGVNLETERFTITIGGKLTLDVSPGSFKKIGMTWRYTGTTSDGTRWSVVVGSFRHARALLITAMLRGNLSGEWPFRVVLSIGDDAGTATSKALTAEF